MKKLLTGLFALFAFGAIAFAGENNETLTPVLSVLGTNAITIYCVGGATTTAASLHITADSATFVTAGGLFPGTTSLIFSQANIDTLGEFITYVNALPTNTPGAEGGIRAALVNGCYDGNVTSTLTVTGVQSIFGSAAAKTLTVDKMLGISYILPASALRWRQQYHITGLNANATYGSGTVTLNIYDGALATNSNIFRYKINATTVETPIYDFLNGGDFAGSNETAMRIDMIASVEMTAGYISIIGFKK